MKTKIIAAFAAAILIISFISCGWFGSDKKPAFNIHGEWTIDSIVNKGHDSASDVGLLVTAMANADSARIRFDKDSTFHYVNDKEKGSGRYYLSANSDSLFLQPDSIAHPFSFVQKSGSSISFISADSVVYYLRKN